MQRRDVLRGVSGGMAATALSGCIGGILNCGPGDDKITDIDSEPGSYEDTEVALKGEVASVEGDSHFVLNDGTGKADVKSIGKLDTQGLKDATCVEVSGYVLIDETKEGDRPEVVATSVVGEVMEEG